jgi:hypothetical protein
VELIVGDPDGSRTLLALSNPIFLEPEGQEQPSLAPWKPGC